MEIYILDSRILDILIMSLAFCFIIRCFESALFKTSSSTTNHVEYIILSTLLRKIFFQPRIDFLRIVIVRTETSLQTLLSLIICSVSEHIICLVDNLAVQEDVEPLRQRAVRGGGLVPHIVNQERPGQLLRPQQLACSVAVSASERTLC